MSREKKSGSAEPREDPLVEKLLSESKEPPDVRMVSGFLGKGMEPGKWRLYLSPLLNDYLEFDKESIVHSQSLDKEQSAMGGSVVYLRNDAKVTHVRITKTDAQAEFLQGDVAKVFTQNVETMGPGGREAYPIATLTTYCTSFYYRCPPPTITCPTLTCPSIWMTCIPTIRCPTIYCPSIPYCPSMAFCPSLACWTQSSTSPAQ